MAKYKGRYLFGLLASGLFMWALNYLVQFEYEKEVSLQTFSQSNRSDIFKIISSRKHKYIHQAAVSLKSPPPIMVAMPISSEEELVETGTKAQNNYANLYFEQRRKSQSYFQNNFSASVTPSNYLKFINTLHDELSLGSVPEEKKRELEDLIRSGHGLEPYVTERGEAAWIENGIVYRPWRRPDPSTMNKKYPSPYTTEYELYIPFNEELFFEGRKPDPSYKTQRKIILWHTKTRYTEPKEDLQPLKVCPDFPCYITTNKSYSENSSAMIFAAQILESAPPKRRANQIFILHNHEPPYVNKYFDRAWSEGFKQPGWKQAFNWTMTYRMDSDMVVPYAVVRRRPTPLMNKDYKGIVANKTRFVAWIVSNCVTSSRREVYVQALRKYIPIDIFGKCAEKKCPHQENWKCSQMISEKYKFYIGFESAFCPDYITEKTFHYLTMDTITIARGSNEYFQHVPREIYLNTANFPSPKALAERLWYLHNNDQAYIKMLKEKDMYMSNMEGFLVREPNGYVRVLVYRLDTPALCLACLRLWNLDKYAKSLADSHTWLESKICRKAKDLNF